MAFQNQVQSYINDTVSPNTIQLVSVDFPLPVTSGSGTPGTPAGAVQSVQGVTGGTPVPISGSLTITPAVPTNLVAGDTTVTTAAAQFWAAQANGTGTAAVTNTDATNSVWIGPAGVSSTTGYKLAPGSGVSFDPHLAMYCICTAGSPVISWIGAHA